MSETERFEPQAPTKKWPTLEELAEMANKIDIPEKWQTDLKPLTPETLRDICRRLADETPLSLEEWRKLREVLYNKINYSKQPEVQRLWELTIERGIDGLAHLIEVSTPEQIRKSAEAHPSKDYKDPKFYWLAGTAKTWHDNIIRVLDISIGTTVQGIEKLAQKLMEQASIPFAKRAKELGASGADAIEATVDRLEYVRTYSSKQQKDETRIAQRVQEIMSTI